MRGRQRPNPTPEFITAEWALCAAADVTKRELSAERVMTRNNAALAGRMRPRRSAPGHDKLRDTDEDLAWTRGPR